MLCDTVQRVESAVGRLFRILELHKQVPRHFHGNVVTGDRGLRFDVYGSLANVDHVRNLVHQWNRQEPTAFFHGVEFSETFHDELVPLWNDVEDRVGLGYRPSPGYASVSTAAAAAPTKAIQNVAAKVSSRCGTTTGGVWIGGGKQFRPRHSPCVQSAGSATNPKRSLCYCCHRVIHPVSSCCKLSCAARSDPNRPRKCVGLLVGFVGLKRKRVDLLLLVVVPTK
mmetsp:Transcript_27104/g.58018  ORF Transcript_27104/g.58018 Transcript_27104/m.58018 type:complete len:225 (-) Transcript_27104:50-724(-)